MNTINICENCFEAVIPECVENFKIGRFENNQSVVLYVENFHGKSNALELTANVRGLITVDYNAFGKGYFNSENSPYIFTFKTDAFDCELLGFNQCIDGVSESFKCLVIDFIKTNDPLLYTNLIDCQCLGETADPAPPSEPQLPQQAE